MKPRPRFSLMRPLALLAICVALQCDACVPPNEKSTILKEPVVATTSTIEGRVQAVGYAGLDSAVLRRDIHRLRLVIESDGAIDLWPVRDTHGVGDLQDFPNSVGKPTQAAEAVPIMCVVDPSEIDSAWAQVLSNSVKAVLPERKQAAPLDRFGALEGPPASSTVVQIEPTNFKPNHIMPFTWPSWADDRLFDPNRNAKYPAIAKYKWTHLVIPTLGYPHLSAQLSGLGVRSTGSFAVVGVSTSAWRVIAPEKADPYNNQWPRGTLVFPLWESVGILRHEATDTLSDQRNGPMSAHVESPDFEWKVRGRSAFVMAAPIPRQGKRIAAREYIVLPETLAKQPVPIMSVYKAKTWKPFAEDYVFRVGPPTTTEGLRAVCVFMTATDEQLRDVVKAMCRTEPEKPDQKAITPNAAEPIVGPAARK